MHGDDWHGRASGATSYGVRPYTDCNDPKRCCRCQVCQSFLRLLGLTAVGYGPKHPSMAALEGVSQAW